MVLDCDNACKRRQSQYCTLQMLFTVAQVPSLYDIKKFEIEIAHKSVAICNFVH